MGESTIKVLPFGSKMHIWSHHSDGFPLIEAQFGINRYVRFKPLGKKV